MGFLKTTLGKIIFFLMCGVFISAYYYALDTWIEMEHNKKISKEVKKDGDS